MGFAEFGKLPQRSLRLTQTLAQWWGQGGKESSRFPRDAIPVLKNSWWSTPSDGRAAARQNSTDKRGQGTQADLSAIVPTQQQTHGLKLFHLISQTGLGNQIILPAGDGWGEEKRLRKESLKSLSPSFFVPNLSLYEQTAESLHGEKQGSLVLRILHLCQRRQLVSTEQSSRLHTR